MKQALLVFISFLLLSLLVLTWVSRDFLLPKEKQEASVLFVIEPGAKGSDIARNLHDQGIIRSSWSFRFLTRLTKTGDKIIAGTYALSPSLSEHEILRMLLSGRGVVTRVTIPEGYSLKQIAELLEKKGIVLADLFLEKANEAIFDIPEAHMVIHRLEGYLFPDTYDFQPRVTPEEIFKPMLARFKELVLPLYLQSKSNLHLNQIITLASLIEKEGKVGKELPLISAVYYNRLKDQIPLQCDATIQYLLPEFKELLSENDLKIESPYNTYLHAGLPPGPIGSPGLNAIKAAFYPAPVAYRYYVLEGKGGRHIFSVTYGEHLHAVERYNQWLHRRNHN